jgi:hypothetical protein
MSSSTSLDDAIGGLRGPRVTEKGEFCVPHSQRLIDDCRDGTSCASINQLQSTPINLLLHAPTPLHLSMCDVQHFGILQKFLALALESRVGHTGRIKKHLKMPKCKQLHWQPITSRRPTPPPRWIYKTNVSDGPHGN